MADPVRYLAALLTHEGGDGRQVVARVIGHTVVAIGLVALGQTMAAHLRNPHIEPGPRQKGAQAQALGGKPEASIGKTAMQQDHRNAAHRAAIGHAQTGDGQLHGAVRAVPGLEAVDIFAQITAPFGANQGDRK